jgi:hypothetical protein
MIFLTSGEYGRLGHGDNVTQLRPKQVKSLIGQRVVQVEHFNTFDRFLCIYLVHIGKQTIIGKTV